MPSYPYRPKRPAWQEALLGLISGAERFAVGQLNAQERDRQYSREQQERDQRRREQLAHVLGPLIGAHPAAAGRVAEAQTKLITGEAKSLDDFKRPPIESPGAPGALPLLAATPLKIPERRGVAALIDGAPTRDEVEQRGRMDLAGATEKRMLAVQEARDREASGRQQARDAAAMERARFAAQERSKIAQEREEARIFNDAYDETLRHTGNPEQAGAAGRQAMATYRQSQGRSRPIDAEQFTRQLPTFQTPTTINAGEAPSRNALRNAQTGLATARTQRTQELLPAEKAVLGLRADVLAAQIQHLHHSRRLRIWDLKLKQRDLSLDERRIAEQEVHNAAMEELGAARNQIAGLRLDKGEQDALEREIGAAEDKLLNLEAAAQNPDYAGLVGQIQQRIAAVKQRRDALRQRAGTAGGNPAKAAVEGALARFRARHRREPSESERNEISRVVRSRLGGG